MPPKFSEEFYKDKPELRLGSGGEKVVFNDPDNPDRKIGFFFGQETPGLVRGRFYLTKIARLFYPENLLKIHTVASKPNLIYAEKLNIGPDTDTIFDGDADKLIEDVRNKIGVSMDSYIGNWRVTNKEGNLCYLDTLSPWFRDKKSYDPEKIKIALESLDPESKEKGMEYLARLEDLFGSEMELNKKLLEEIKERK